MSERRISRDVSDGVSPELPTGLSDIVASTQAKRGDMFEFTDIPGNGRAQTENWKSEPVCSSANTTGENANKCNSRGLYSLPGRLDNVGAREVNQETTICPESMTVLTSISTEPVSMSAFGDGSLFGFRDSLSLGSAQGPQNTVVFDLKRAMYPQYVTSNARRATFIDWSPNHCQRPEDLVNAGLFYAGYGDCARCFYCGLGLRSWRAEDRPDYQHVLHRPTCAFIRLFKGQDFVDNVQHGIVSDHGPADQGSRQTPDQPRPSQPERKQVNSATSQADGSPTVSAAEELMNTSAVLQVLLEGQSWSAVKQAVDALLALGLGSEIQPQLINDFIYNLAESSTESTTDTSTPGPTSSSENSSSNSNNLTSTSASHLENQADETSDSCGWPQATNEALQSSTSLVQQPAAPQIDPRQKTQMIEREHKYLKQRINCCQCLVNPVDCINLPCGHVVACQKCVDAISSCPFCHKTILGTSHVFFS